MVWHTVEMIEALFSRQEFRLRAKVPFADHVGRVPLLAELLGNRDLTRVEPEKPVGRPIRIDAHVESGTLGISARQKSRP